MFHQLLIFNTGTKLIAKSTKMINKYDFRANIRLNMP